MRGMLAEMTATELAEWEAFFDLEPWGSEIEDHRAGIIAATIANMSGKVVKKGMTARPSDYFPSRVQVMAQASMSVADKVKAIFGWKGRK